MALEGRNIIGQAQVYNQTRDAVNEYAKALQQQQLQREREAKVLTDELSKVKLDGIRQPDIPEFTSKYREAKDLFAKRLAARKPEEKIALDSEFKTKMLELSEIAEDSKALAKGEMEFSKMLLNPNIRDRYVPDAVDRFQRAKTLSRKDPNYVRDLTQLEQQIDLSAIMNDLDKIDNTILKSSQWQRTEERGMQGNRQGVFVTQMRSTDPQKQIISYGAEFDLNPKFRTALRQMFPQLADLPNEQLKAAAIPELVNQRAKTETEKSEFKPDDMFLRNLAARDRAIRARADLRDGGRAGDVLSMNIPFVSGKGSFIADEYVPISLPKKNFAGSEYIDLKTGKPSKDRLASSNDYEIVGVANVPLVRNVVKEKSLHGAVAQPDFVKNNPNLVEFKPMIHVQLPLPGGRGLKRDLLVPYDRLPENIKNSKSVRDALKGFTPATKDTQPKAPAQQPKQGKELVGTSAQLEAAAKSRGLTKAEYKKQLEAAGYIVKEK